MKKQKKAKKETRHLADPARADKHLTLCGRPIEKVLLWAKKSPPKADDATVCGRCRKLAAGKAEKIEKRHRGTSPTAAPLKDVKKLNKAVKRQPALLVLGDRMPDELRVTFKGQEYLAAVDKDGGIRVEGHGQTYFSPSRAGKAVAGREVDGWTFWSFVNVAGELEKLNALRKAVA